jgi:hypothetical protein
MSLITVVVPVGPRHANFLPRALESIRQQTLPASWIQTIVVNDSGKPLALPNLPNLNAQLLKTKGEQGSSVARNLGLNQAATSLVTFLDVDDWLVNIGLEVLLRGMADLQSSYIYGDGWTVENGKRGVYTAPVYDRQLLLRRNIHNVTALCSTAHARAIGGFDETIKSSWEDWHFFLRMAANGFCGAKVKAPIIVYDLEAGFNRSYTATIAPQVYALLRERFGETFEGGNLMPCCGGDPNAQAQARQALKQLAQANYPDGVRMEWMGANMGGVAYKSSVSGKRYYLSSEENLRFFICDPLDVEWLEALGARRAPVAATPPLFPAQMLSNPPALVGEPPLKMPMSAEPVAAAVVVESFDEAAATPSVAPTVTATQKTKRVRKPKPPKAAAIPAEPAATA